MLKIETSVDPKLPKIAKSKQASILRLDASEHRGQQPLLHSTFLRDGRIGPHPACNGRGDRDVRTAGKKIGDQKSRIAKTRVRKELGLLPIPI